MRRGSAKPSYLEAGRQDEHDQREPAGGEDERTHGDSLGGADEHPVSRSLGFFAAALLALGGGAAAAPAPDEGLRAVALERLVQAAWANDEPAMWASLSRLSKRRLGPTLADFRRRGARGVRDALAPLASHRVILDTAVEPRLGVVAIANRSQAFAAPVRQEAGAWKVELLPGFTVEAVRPLPGERIVRRTQLAAEVVAPGKIVEAAVWFDGRLFDARLYRSPNGTRMSMWGEAPQPLRSGRHTVVAFASTRGAASANAWTFTARGRGSGSRWRARTSP